MLTRAGVAKRLGRSIATVRRLEGTELHPWTDARGVHQFDRDEVEQLARTDCEGSRDAVGMRSIDASHLVERLERELAASQEALQTARQRAADLDSQNQELRTAAIDALELVQVLLDVETPYVVRRCLRDLRRQS